MEPLFIIEPHSKSSQQRLSWQPNGGNYLAIYGGNMVSVYDRDGNCLDKVDLGGLCQLGVWDSDGDLFAVIYGSSSVLLWNAASRRNHTLEIGLKDVATFVSWAVSQALLAIGTEKGNLLLYSARTGRKIPVLGKHNKRITCGSWSEEFLALGSEDKSLSISTLDGDTIHTLNLRSQPSLIKFTNLKFQESKVKNMNTLSVVIGRKTLLILNLDDYENPQELAFQQKYGMIVGYEWFGDDNIGVAFSNGFFVAVSARNDHIGQELYQSREFSNILNDMSISNTLNRIALIGDDSVKFKDTENLKLPIKSIVVNNENIEFASWSEDGRILAVSSSETGRVYAYMTKLPNLCAAFGPYLLILAGFKKLELHRQSKPGSMSELKIDKEADFLHIGPSYLGFGLGNRVWYFFYEDRKITMVTEKNYNGVVVDVLTNIEYTAVSCSDKVYIHKVESVENDEIQIYPNDEFANFAVTAHALTSTCLIYSLENGNVHFINVTEAVQVTTLNHHCGIVELSVSPSGYLTCFQDTCGNTFIHDFVTNELTKLEFKNIDSFLWEHGEFRRKIFVTVIDKTAKYFAYQEEGEESPYILEVAEQTLGENFVFHLCSAQLFQCGDGGKVITTQTPYHPSRLEKSKKDPERKIRLLINMGEYQRAINLCHEVGCKDKIKEIAENALKMFDFDNAVNAFTQINDIKTAMTIKKFTHLENEFLLKGQVAVVLKKFDTAEAMFLQSDPIYALRLRAALQQWDRALILAKQHSPSEVPLVSYELAKQLEFSGDYLEAKIYYEAALRFELSEEKYSKCLAGLARSLLKCDEFQQGLKYAHKVKEEQQIEEIAEILEEKKHNSEACSFYERAGNWNKAAFLCVHLKLWSKLRDIIKTADSPKIHAFYAKALEQEKDYRNATEHYLKSGDELSAVRILVEKMKDIESAVKVYNNHRNVEIASLIANAYAEAKDIKLAIKYMITAHRRNDAIDLAKKSNCLSIFNELADIDGTTEDFLELAINFELNGNRLEAGKYYAKAKRFDKALSTLLNDISNVECVEEAVRIVVLCKDTYVVDKTITIFRDEPNCQRYLPELYSAKGDFSEAANVAFRLAETEQRNGNYKIARAVLIDSIRRLRASNLSVPLDLIRTLELVHSYLLVRIHLQKSNHLAAAQMLLRVSRSLSKFQRHAVHILTTAVLECQRAGLRKSAYSIAAMLLNSKSKEQIDKKYKLKIENAARKPPREEDQEDEDLTPCPYCGEMCFVTSLACEGCKNTIPMCIATGYHVTKHDLVVSPCCSFPAKQDALVDLVSINNCCPLCETIINVDDIHY
ncbi:hypothetical protein QYM36_014460, partial [Artemia franciscana]